AFEFIAKSSQTLLKQNSSLENQKKIQAEINSILRSNGGEYAKHLATLSSLAEKEKFILSIIREREALRGAEARQGLALASSIGSKYILTDNGLLKAGKNPRKFINRVLSGASGILPAIEREKMDIRDGVGGANPHSKPVIIKDFSFGDGKHGPIVANTDEYIVKNFAGSGASAILNKEMIRKIGLPPGAKRITTAADGLVPNANLSYPLAKKEEMMIGSAIGWKSIIKNMSPDEFLRFAYPFPSSYINSPEFEKRMKAFSKHIMEGRPLDPLQLWLNPDYEVDGHEGRHRAHAARRLGIKSVPVALELERFGRIPNLKKSGELEKILSSKFVPEYLASKRITDRKFGFNFLGDNVPSFASGNIQSLLEYLKLPMLSEEELIQKYKDAPNLISNVRFALGGRATLREKLLSGKPLTEKEKLEAARIGLIESRNVRFGPGINVERSLEKGSEEYIRFLESRRGFFGQLRKPGEKLLPLFDMLGEPGSRYFSPYLHLIDQATIQGAKYRVGALPLGMRRFADKRTLDFYRSLAKSSTGKAGGYIPNFAGGRLPLHPSIIEMLRKGILPKDFR
ncbi:MAG: hypothetical protein D6785_07190, partial [Planctomycetota bacterium]